ncbi:hypothetical protein [Sphingomonas abietis]|uniref:Regulatory protein RecX n=1 Tax=Sphingomonas abietis TaxID=3012344 RepID=A0ABY7NU02_9SPHN|nr:hypothetical protein [Sphingomonas abietis]WBO23414.1 hypothetical protein PBT88_04600 [Sphingomonas abietis]
MVDIKAQPHLTTAEWQAVTVALRDAARFGCAAPQGKPEGRVSRLFRALTGIEQPRPLADPRLDAVRRFVCASRRNVARAREIASELMAMGYSRDQIEALRIVAA